MAGGRGEGGGGTGVSMSKPLATMCGASLTSVTSMAGGGGGGGMSKALATRCCASLTSATSIGGGVGGGGRGCLKPLPQSVGLPLPLLQAWQEGWGGGLSKAHATRCGTSLTSATSIGGGGGGGESV